jgi:probable HAF family extracellular repeat protein
MKRILCLLFAGISILVLPASDALAAPYQVVEVGLFGPGNYPTVTGMNNSGTLVGAISSTNSESAFTWSASTALEYLSPLAGYATSHASGRNDKGQVVGSCISGYSTGYATRACLWESGKPVTDMGALPSGEYSPYSSAASISSSGQAVGVSRSSSGSGSGYLHAFLWSSGTGIEDLNATEVLGSAHAYAINDSAAVVGKHGGYGFIWTRATGMSDITLTPPGTPSMATSINNSGQVVLQAYTASSTGPAYVWQEGHDLLPLGALPGGSGEIWANDINNLGEVVGKSNDQAFVWDSTNGIQALPLLPGLWHGTAGAINDSSMIAGTARDSQGNTHLLLWTIPEPSSLLALLAGLGSVGGVMLKRRRR